MHKKTKSVFIKDTKVIKGEYHPIKDWKMDKKGYFLIRINRRKKIIELGHCKKDNVIEVVIQGKNPQEIYFNACKMKLVGRFDHAAYLGKELEKAYLALKYRLNYVQDEELKIK
jgi:tetrahydromethanopterin S-methyltransferase subunit A